MKNAIGRPCEYNLETVDELIDRLSSGEPLRKICRCDSMPNVKTVYAWMKINSEFAARFARAREEGFDAIAEDCLDIADDASQDEIDTPNGPKANGEFMARSRLRVETRLKLLARWDPKRYGEKLDVTGVPASSVNVLLSTRDKLKRLKRAMEESDAPAAIESGGVPRGTIEGVEQ